MKFSILLALISCFFAPFFVSAQINPVGSGQMHCGIYFKYDAGGNCTKEYYDCKFFDHAGHIPLRTTTVKASTPVDTPRIGSLSASDFVTVFPNPTSGKFSITLSSDEHSHFHLYDSKGAILGSGYIDNKKYEGDVSGAPPGIYTIVVQFHQRIFSFKLTKL